MFFKRYRQLEKRISTLEQASKAVTWSHGEVGIAELARAVESLEQKIKAADEATSTAQTLTPDNSTERS